MMLRDVKITGGLNSSAIMLTGDSFILGCIFEGVYFIVDHDNPPKKITISQNLFFGCDDYMRAFFKDCEKLGIQLEITWNNFQHIPNLPWYKKLWNYFAAKPLGEPQ